jgi:hypothetical protein
MSVDLIRLGFEADRFAWRRPFLSGDGRQGFSEYDVLYDSGIESAAVTGRGKSRIIG